MRRPALVEQPTPGAFSFEREQPQPLRPALMERGTLQVPDRSTPLKGAVELGATLGSGTALGYLQPYLDIYHLVTGGILDPGIGKVSEEWTYEPKGKHARKAMEKAAPALQWLEEKGNAPGDWLYEKTGSEALGTLGRSLVWGGPELFSKLVDLRALRTPGRLDIGGYSGSPGRWRPRERDDALGVDLSRIDSGEGTQWEGWGVYFSERPEIARWYRDRYGKPEERGNLFIEGTPVTDLSESANEILTRYHALIDRHGEGSDIVRKYEHDFLDDPRTLSERVGLGENEAALVRRAMQREQFDALYSPVQERRDVAQRMHDQLKQYHSEMDRDKWRETGAAFRGVFDGLVMQGQIDPAQGHALKKLTFARHEQPFPELPRHGGKRVNKDIFQDTKEVGTTYSINGERIFEPSGGRDPGFIDALEDAAYLQANNGYPELARKLAWEREMVAKYSSPVEGVDELSRIQDLSWHQSRLRALEMANEGRIERMPHGSVTYAELPDPDVLLHRELPLSQQPPKVQAGLDALFEDMENTLAGFEQKALRRIRKEGWGSDLQGSGDVSEFERMARNYVGIKQGRGGNFLSDIDPLGDSPEKITSLLLGKHGIPGNRYLIGKHRYEKGVYDPEANFNHVIWDEDAVDVYGADDPSYVLEGGKRENQPPPLSKAMQEGGHDYPPLPGPEVNRFLKKAYPEQIDSAAHRLDSWLLNTRPENPMHETASTYLDELVSYHPRLKQQLPSYKANLKSKFPVIEKYENFDPYATPDDPTELLSKLQEAQTDYKAIEALSDADKNSVLPQIKMAKGAYANKLGNNPQFWEGIFDTYGISVMGGPGNPHNGMFLPSFYDLPQPEKIEAINKAIGNMMDWYHHQGGKQLGYEMRQFVKMHKEKLESTRLMIKESMKSDEPGLAEFFGPKPEGLPPADDFDMFADDIKF